MRPFFVSTLALAVVSCSQPCCTSPSSPPLPLALTGQSQAVILAPHLMQAYSGLVVGAWESGQSIAFWGPEDRMWRALAPQLHQRLRALIYWQGESDCQGLATAVSDYGPRFRDLMRRIRVEADDPQLPMMIVTVSPVDICMDVRREQAAWAAMDLHARIINADDIPRMNWPIDLHITEAGAELMAQRIVGQLP